MFIGAFLVLVYLSEVLKTNNKAKNKMEEMNRKSEITNPAKTGNNKIKVRRLFICLLDSVKAFGISVAAACVLIIL